MTSPNMSMKDLRDQRERDLGPSAGPIYNALHDQVTDLHAKWEQYRVLYVESDEHIKVLNGAAPYLFGVLQDVLWRDVVLHIARLMDPPASGRGGTQENLTLEALAQAVATPGLHDELVDLVGKAKEEADFAITWRHKNLAHLDRGYALRTTATPLPKVTGENVECAMAAVKAVLNAVAKHSWKVHIDFTPVVMDDARSLLYFIRTGIESYEANRQRPTGG